MAVDAAEEFRIDLQHGLAGGLVSGGLGFALSLETQVNACLKECGLSELANGGGNARGKDEIIRHGVLEGAPHALDVLGGVTPVAFGVEIAKFEDFVGAGLNAGNGGCDFASDEAFAAPGRLVIVEDAADHEHAVGFAIDAAEITETDRFNRKGHAERLENERDWPPRRNQQ